MGINPFNGRSDNAVGVPMPGDNDSVVCRGCGAVNSWSEIVKEFEEKKNKGGAKDGPSCVGCHAHIRLAAGGH